MTKLIKNLLKVMTKKQKKELIILQILVVTSAIFEVCGVLAIGPFMALVGNIGLIETHELINPIYVYSGISNPVDFLAATGFLVLGLMFLAAITSIFTIWKLSLFAANVGAEFGDRLFKHYMRKDYLYHTSINSADLTKKIAIEVNRVTDNVLQAMVQINARIATVAFISLFVFLYNPYIAVSGVVILSFAYCTLYYFVKNKLSANGGLISKYSKKRFSLMNEGFGALKEVQILGREEYFIDQFKQSGKVFAGAYGTSNGLYNMPRYFMEFIVYSSMVGLVLLLLKKYDGELSVVLPIMAVFGIAAFKLLPSFQQMYSGAAQIRSNISAFEAIETDLIEALEESSFDPKRTDHKIRGDINLTDAFFSFDANKSPTLNNISVSIPLKTTIGIVGPSGSGKSTLLDVLIGSIKLVHGELKVGGTIIDEFNKGEWQNSIGYVSQMSLIKDGSIAENIAFGVDAADISKEKLIKAAAMAQLTEWVESLSDSYATQVGERGLQISGGQRQRIAIARALYNDAEYLFFDEATSALDGLTEKNIMESISNMAGLKTIIMVAHRLNTVRDCDHIYIVDEGRISDHGSYQYLMETNKKFIQMSGLGK